MPLKNAHEVGKAEMMMTCSVQRLLDARKISVNEESLEVKRVICSTLQCLVKHVSAIEQIRLINFDLDKHVSPFS